MSEPTQSTCTTPMRYWIFDQDHTPQRFPLQRLLRSVRAVGDTETSICLVRKARGYGARIRAWELALDSAEEIEVEIEALDEVSAGTVEWFYDLEVHPVGSDILFGLHDSTALFVEGDSTVVAPIAAEFAEVRHALK